MAEGFAALSAIAISLDLWRLYIADSSRDVFTLLQSAKTEALGILKFSLPFICLLNLPIPARMIFALIAMTGCLRLQIGEFNVFVHMGLSILFCLFRKNETPRRLTISGGYLFAQCGDKTYCRKIKSSAKEVSLEPKAPKFISYYD